MSAHVLLMVENVSLARDHRLRKQAESLRSAGLDVTVICPRDPGNRCLEGVRVLDYRPPPAGTTRLGFVWEYAYSWLMAMFLTCRVFATHRFDVIQISGTPDIYFTIAWPFRVLGVPLVLDQRDLSPEVYASRYGSGGAVHRALLWWERHSYRAADHVVTVNESLRRVVRDRGGVPARSVTVVGNGPRLSRTKPGSAGADPRRDGVQTCCWVGMMGPQDRLDLLLSAVQHLVHGLGRRRVRIVLIGDGEDRSRVEHLVRELGLQGYVELTGWLPEAEVFERLGTADLGLEPNMEPFVSPVKVMEYMAFGLPFVAFDLEETRTLAEESGEYVEPGDVTAFARSMDLLLDSPSVRARRGAAGRRIVADRVAWEHQERAYLAVYRKLLVPSVTALRSPLDRAS